MTDTTGEGQGTRPDQEGWADRVVVKTTTDGFAYVPGEVLTTDPGRALELARDLFPDTEITPDEEPILKRFTRLRGVPDVPALVEYLERFGVTSQPNHVFFAHCDDPCCGRPHPAARCACGGGGGPSASPVYASPVYASPVYASPVYASPVYASPVYASPVYASPVYASPVYASPVYASEYVHTGRRRSSAVAVTDADAAALSARLHLIKAAKVKDAKPDVVVLDTGLASFPDFFPTGLGSLRAIVVPGPRTEDGDDVPDRVVVDDMLDPAAGHGTFIAGLIEQVAPGARIEVRRVLAPEGDGDEACIANAIDALDDRSADGDRGAVLNLSFGGYVMKDPDVLATAVARAQKKGYVVVASAGNDGTCRKAYPAALPDVIAVGAIGPSGPAPFTNYGPWVRACAPGVDLVSTFFTNFNGALGPDQPLDPDPDDFTGWARWSGTSFSAPVVAGAIVQYAIAHRVDKLAKAVERVVDDPALLRLADLGTVVNLL